MYRVETCKNGGLSEASAETCRKAIIGRLLSRENERMAGLGCKMLTYFDEELKMLKRAEVIEFIHEVYVDFIEPRPTSIRCKLNVTF